MVDSATRDDVVRMVQEALGIPHMGVENDEPTASDPAQAGASDPSHVEEDDLVRIGENDETLKYFKLLEDAQTDLCPGVRNLLYYHSLFEFCIWRCSINGPTSSLTCYLNFWMRLFLRAYNFQVHIIKLRRLLQIRVSHMRLLMLAPIVVCCLEKRIQNLINVLYAVVLDGNKTVVLEMIKGNLVNG